MRDEEEQRWAQLKAAKRPETQSFAEAWVGLEPTFSDKKAVKKWGRAAERGKKGEDQYFESKHMVGTVEAVARTMRRAYRDLAANGDPGCVFERCDLELDKDPWDVLRANLSFGDGKHEFEVRFGMDPETFELSIKPVPLAWLYDPHFVRFLDIFVWGAPKAHGLAASMAHGGGQFSFSAKTFLTGSLLADDIASKLNHPELSTWILDYPNPDDRAFRATGPRTFAFAQILEQYWAGAFHPRANGGLTVANALLDRGFLPVPAPPPGLMDPERGPVGDAREVFQNNFAFGRQVRWSAQNVDAGYWQSSHPEADGYRADQIMRYSEGNLNRLQIAGEWHVKSGALLDPKDVPAFDAPLDLSMLYDEASWEQRGHMSRTSADDMVEAILLEAHHAQYLVAHPHVRAKAALLQDQLLGDAEHVLERSAPDVLSKLRKQAREDNLAASRNRIKSDWIEPEALFWASWKAISNGSRAEIAREAVLGFMERVENAAAHDPRDPDGVDPMEAHRHRVHPLLFEALLASPERGTAHDEARRWKDGEESYRARRPPWSVTNATPPWEA